MSTSPLVARDDRGKNHSSSSLWIATSLWMLRCDRDTRIIVLHEKPHRPRHGVQLPRVALMRACPRRATSFESGMIYEYGFLRFPTIRCTDREMTESPLPPSLPLSLSLSRSFPLSFNRSHYLSILYTWTLHLPYSLRFTRSILPIATFRVTLSLFSTSHFVIAIENFTGIWSIPHAPRSEVRSVHTCDHDHPLDI